MLILARESGLSLEEKEIDIVSFLPEGAMEANSVDEFYKLVKVQDEHFKSKIAEAESKNQKLRFIARLENNKAKISLEQVGSESPFYGLSGSDNIISFSSKRYNNSPLVIRGPGAGADVTAAGVLAEIINMSKEI